MYELSSRVEKEEEGREVEEEIVVVANSVENRLIFGKSIRFDVKRVAKRVCLTRFWKICRGGGGGDSQDADEFRRDSYSARPVRLSRNEYPAIFLKPYDGLKKRKKVDTRLTFCFLSRCY